MAAASGSRISARTKVAVRLPRGGSARKLIGLVPRADHDLGSGSEERLGDPAPDSADPAGHQNASTCIVDAAGAGHGLVRYQASAWARRAVLPVGIEVNRHGPIAEIVVNYPPVNALPVAGWFDLADALISAGSRRERSRRRAGRRGPRVQRRRRHQGDAAHHRLRLAHRGQPRLLRRVCGRLRVRRPGRRSGATASASAAASAWSAMPM